MKLVDDNVENIDAYMLFKEILTLEKRSTICKANEHTKQELYHQHILLLSHFWVVFMDKTNHLEFDGELTHEESMKIL